MKQADKEYIKTFDCIIKKCNKKDLFYPNRHFLFQTTQDNYALCNKHGKIANIIKQQNPEFLKITYNNLNQIIELITQYKKWDENMQKMSIR